jgi:hypothetical protein
MYIYIQRKTIWNNFLFRNRNYHIPSKRNGVIVLKKCWDIAFYGEIILCLRETLELECP